MPAVVWRARQRETIVDRCRPRECDDERDTEGGSCSFFSGCGSYPALNRSAREARARQCRVKKKSEREREREREKERATEGGPREPCGSRKERVFL